MPRLDWAHLPLHLRTTIQATLGARVVSDIPQQGGFSPGLASQLILADGRTVFAKAISAGQNPKSPELYRREARAMRSLPTAAPAPRLLWDHDDGEWVTLVMEWVTGRLPTEPWTHQDLDRVITALAEVAHTLTPSPVQALSAVEDLAPLFGRWRDLAARPGQAAGLDPWARDHLDRLAEVESGWEQAVQGTTLLHTDLRADNILLTPDRVVIVDWAYTVVGAPWLDLVLMLPSVAATTPGLDPQRAWESFPPAARAPEQGVNAVLAAQAGALLTQSLEPPLPGIDRLREHQRAKGQAALNWLCARIDPSQDTERPV